MSDITQNLLKIRSKLQPNVTLAAVSKTKSNEEILEAYRAGQRIFAENYVQELQSKMPSLPADIEWHMIGHLQTNKVKYIAKHITMIQSVDSLKLLGEINKQAAKYGRIIEVLLQVHIATEDSKTGFTTDELTNLIQQNELASLSNVKVKGLMGMASFSSDLGLVEKEFRNLKTIFDQFAPSFGWNTLSMGMSQDFELAMDCGSNMVRVGSSIFGSRSPQIGK